MILRGVHQLILRSRWLPLAALLVLRSGLAAPPEAGAQSVAARPNILLILVDDMGYSDLGAYGGEIDTPHLDRLAHQGIRFRQFYNNAKCTPTRASLLTGRDAHEVGHAFNPPGRGRMRDPGAYQGHFPEHAATIAELLRKAGYRTYMSGKWHLGDEPPNWPRQHGFDRFFGIVSGASSYFELLQEPGRPREMALEDSLWLPPENGWYATDAYTDYAIERIQDHHARHSSRPFFLYLSYTAPHFPLHALPEDIQRYRGRYDAGWDRLRQDRYARMLKMGVITDRWVLPPHPPEVPAWDEVEEADRDEWLQRIEVYAAMVDRVDQGVGRILRALEETGQAENTLILFLSDNGATAADVEDRGLHDPSVPIGARGSYVAHREPWAYALNTPFRLYKAWIHEGGINTPFIAHWPRGISQRGQFTDEVGHIIDILPTALELAGATFPSSWNGHDLAPLRGRSFAPVFRGEALPPRQPLFWAHLGSWGMRDGDWKLVFDGRRARHLELFHLRDDPTEMRDLGELHPDRVAKMTAAWRAWAERVGARELHYPDGPYVPPTRPRR